VCVGLTGTKLYCLVTEAHVCEQLAQGCCLKVERPGVEPATFCVASQRHNYYTTRLTYMPNFRKLPFVVWEITASEVLTLEPYLRNHRVNCYMEPQLWPLEQIPYVAGYSRNFQGRCPRTLFRRPKFQRSFPYQQTGNLRKYISLVA